MIIKIFLVVILIFFIIFIFKETKENFYTPSKNIGLNTFELSDYKVLYFDIFLKNNELFLILPVYNKDIYFIDKIRVINNGKNLILKKKILKVRYEPTIILVYDFNSDNNYITLTYNNLVKRYNLEHIKTKKKYKLTLTTLFKDDYYLFDFFYNHYSNQGVEHFYMYYNGILNENIRNIFSNKKNVTLIEWNFKYWNDTSCEFRHHAQMGQIHHAIYRYGKNVSEYMIFCDLDEYMLSPHRKLIQMLNSNYDTYKFCNIFSELLDDRKKITELPNKFKVSKKYKFNSRSKCIHKLDSIETISIHYGYKFLISSPKVIESYNNCLYHFYRFGNKTRRYVCDCIIDITLMKKLLLFIHIPKTGGSYIENEFLKNGYLVGQYFKRNPIYINNYRCNNWHTPPKYMNNIDFNNYIVFTVVRDPLSRFLSEVNWDSFPKYYRNKIKDINTFISTNFKNNDINYDGDCHLVPQIEYLYDKRGKRIENILKQENLNEDLDKFIKKYNLDIVLSYSKNNEKERNNTLNDIGYENVILLKKIYKNDIDLLKSI
tara:strand:- start:3509 stop:5140 length:1632 start_codon:yes stop_codon:yes gene_type:complete